MPSDQEIIITILFNRSGKKKLTSSEIYLTIEIELNWCTLKEAKKFFSQIIKNKLLEKDGDYYKPTFKYRDIEIPVGFKPSNVFFNNNSSNNQIIPLISEMIDIIGKESKSKKEHVIKDINKISNKINITNEVAAFLVAKEYNIDLSVFIKRVKKKIFMEN